MEFDDVILYNFFTYSIDSPNWVLLTNGLKIRKAVMTQQEILDQGLATKNNVIIEKYSKQKIPTDDSEKTDGPPISEPESSDPQPPQENPEIKKFLVTSFEFELNNICDKRKIHVDAWEELCKE
jgi:hypothetical protein